MCTFFGGVHQILGVDFLPHKKGPTGQPGQPGNDNFYYRVHTPMKKTEFQDFSRT